MKKNNGYFGEFGGSFVSPELQNELNNLERAYNSLKNDKEFIKELNEIRRDYQGRPTPLYFAKNLTNYVGGADIYIKREDLNFTGAHKINHCIGECLIAKKLGKTKIIAETGAGQHGLAIATACAYFSLKCDIYMGEVDIKKQSPNVEKMKLLGANVISVTAGQGTLKEAVDEAFKAYQREYKTSLYCIGSVVGPHPFPTMVRNFQRVIGKEAKKQILKQRGCLPDAIVACVGGGSNAMGLFYDFIKTNVKIYGVEALGKGAKVGENSASITYGKTDILHGFKSLVLEDNGKVAETMSVASGLDYPAVGPEHAYLNQIKRVKYVTIDDNEAIEAFLLLTKIEGIIPALESSHAVAYAIKLAKELGKGKSLIVNLSGRGDKDVEFVLENYVKRA